MIWFEFTAYYDKIKRINEWLLIWCSGHKSINISSNGWGETIFLSWHQCSFMRLTAYSSLRKWKICCWQCSAVRLSLKLTGILRGGMVFFIEKNWQNNPCKSNTHILTEKMVCFKQKLCFSSHSRFCFAFYRKTKNYMRFILTEMADSIKSIIHYVYQYCTVHISLDATYMNETYNWLSVFFLNQSA